MRRIILTIATLLALLAFASPAMASGSGHAIKQATQQGVEVDNTFGAYLAETSGALCVDTGGVVQGNYAYNGNCPGRTFTFVGSGGSYNDPDGRCGPADGGPCPIYTIEAGPNMGTGAEECLASTDSTRFTLLKPCAGSTGVNWSALCSNSTCDQVIWINDYASTTNGIDYMLSGDSTHGDRVVPNCWQCKAGQLQRWDLLSP